MMTARANNLVAGEAEGLEPNGKPPSSIAMVRQADYPEQEGNTIPCPDNLHLQTTVLYLGRQISQLTQPTFV